MDAELCIVLSFLYFSFLFFLKLFFIFQPYLPYHGYTTEALHLYYIGALFQIYW